MQKASSRTPKKKIQLVWFINIWSFPFYLKTSGSNGNAGPYSKFLNTAAWIWDKKSLMCNATLVHQHWLAPRRLAPCWNHSHSSCTSCTELNTIRLNLRFLHNRYPSNSTTYQPTYSLCMLTRSTIGWRINLQHKPALLHVMTTILT
jgi:hypothetical protein